MTASLVCMLFLVLLLRPEMPVRHTYGAGYLATVALFAVVWLGAVVAFLVALLRVEGKL